MPERCIEGNTMTFKIVALQQEHEPEWDAYVRNNPDTTFYHQTGWKNVVEKTYGHQSCYFFAGDESGRILGILPLFFINNVFFTKKIVSVPFAPYGGACADNKEVEIALINHALDITKELQVNTCEIRYLSANNYREPFHCISAHSTFLLDVTKGIDHLWESLDRKVRNMIRKGEKNNLTFEMGSALGDVADFYEVYTRNMKYLGTPVHSLGFFTAIFSAFPHQIFIAKVKHENQTIASLFLLQYRDTLISGWGASLVEHLNLAPNDFLYWNSIKFSADRHLSWFDFGRSLAESNNFRFKKRWGSYEKPLQYCYYPKSKQISQPQEQYRHFSGIWKNLPLPVTRMVGPVLRKFIV